MAKTGGFFTGSGGQTVRIVGNSTYEDEWVYRSVWKDGKKAEIMERSNMTHITKFGVKNNGISCQELMFESDRKVATDSRDALYW